MISMTLIVKFNKKTQKMDNTIIKTIWLIEVLMNRWKIYKKWIKILLANLKFKIVKVTICIKIRYQIKIAIKKKIIAIIIKLLTSI